MPGPLQIVRNYQAAARKIGGQILWDDVRRTTIRIAKNAQETWAFLELFNDGRSYESHVVERQQMKQDVEADAAAFQAGVKRGGQTAPGESGVEGLGGGATSHYPARDPPPWSRRLRKRASLRHAWPRMAPARSLP
jgi:hypothetical protein